MNKTRIGMMGLMVLVCGILMAQQSAETNGAAVAGEQVAAQDAPSTGGEFTFFALLVKGGPLMYPLCLCSIIMVAFAIERGVNLRRGKILPPEIWYVIKDFAANADIQSFFRDANVFKILQVVTQRVLPGVWGLRRGLPEAG